MSTTVQDLRSNKALAVAWLEQVSRHDLDAMIETTTEDWRMHGGPPGLASGPAGIRSLFDHIGPVRQQWTVDDVIAEGDRVVVRATNHCVQDEFLGIPAAANYLRPSSLSSRSWAVITRA